jgi:hypothetical protein
VTVTLAVLTLGLTVVFGVLGARPARPLSGPRLIPWRFMMLVAFALMVAALVHVSSLVRGS